MRLAQNAIMRVGLARAQPLHSRTGTCQWEKCEVELAICCSAIALECKIARRAPRDNTKNGRSLHWKHTASKWAEERGASRAIICNQFQIIIFITGEKKIVVQFQTVETNQLILRDVLRTEK